MVGTPASWVDGSPTLPSSSMVSKMPGSRVSPGASTTSREKPAGETITVADSLGSIPLDTARRYCTASAERKITRTSSGLEMLTTLPG